MSRRRDMRSASTPAGIASSRKGRVWADSFSLEKVGIDVPTTGTPRCARAPTNLGFEE